MANSEIDQNELSRLFHVYSPIGLADATRNEAAYVNDVYDLTDVDGGKFVMRVLKIQDPDTVNLEAQMQTRLNEAGIRTPRYLELGENNYVGQEDGRHFTLSKRIDGKAPVDISPELVADFGATLAQIHDCLDGIIVPPNRMQWFDPKIAQADLDAYDGPLKQRLVHLVGKGKELLDLGLPEAVIHGDLWLSNTFAQGNKVTAVFDFETAQNTVRIIDLARTYTSMRRETDIPAQEIIDLLIKGYDSAAKKLLSQSERNNFKLAIAYVSGVVAAWHAAHGTRYIGPYIEIGEEALNITGS